MMFRSIARSLAPFVLFWATLSTVSTSVEAGVDLCGAPGTLPPMDRFDCLIHVRPNLTCGALWMQLLSIPRRGAYSNQMMNLFGNNCCNRNVRPTCLNRPAQPQQPTQPPRGPEPTCNICNYNPNKRPTNNGIRMSIRYLGTSLSCRNLEDKGRGGWIPDWLCGAIAWRIDDICGCQYTGRSNQQEASLGSSPDCGAYTDKQTCKANKANGCHWNKSFSKCLS